MRKLFYIARTATLITYCRIPTNAGPITHLVLPPHRQSTPSLPSPPPHLTPAQPTTGAFICAKSRQTARDLAQQFEARTVEKTYLALLRGDPNREGGVVANALALRDGSVCLARAEDKERLEAVTEWEKLGTSVRRVLCSVVARGLMKGCSRLRRCRS